MFASQAAEGRNSQCWFLNVDFAEGKHAEMRDVATAADKNHRL